MNKLEKWLWSNCELKDNGQISNSLYFKYDILEIRYSDHLASSSSGDLQIIRSSIYDPKVYAVILKGSAKIMIASALQTIEFIQHQAIVQKLLTAEKIKPIASNKDTNKLTLPESLFRPYKTSSKDINKILFKKSEFWSNLEVKRLKQAISQYFKQSCGINIEFIRYIKENKVSYVEAVNLYKIIVFDNKLPFSVPVIDKVLGYIKNLESSNEIQKI